MGKTITIKKARIGECLMASTNEIRYQLQFKEEGRNNYNGFSVDTYETEQEAKKTLENHNNGVCVYKPFAFLGKMNHYFLCKIL